MAVEPASQLQSSTAAIVAPSHGEVDEKGPIYVNSNPAEESEKHDDFPWRWKLTALACGIALSWGSSFSENTLGPLKDTLKKQLDITNAQVRIYAESSLQSIRFWC